MAETQGQDERCLILLQDFSADRAAGQGANQNVRTFQHMTQLKLSSGINGRALGKAILFLPLVYSMTLMWWLPDAVKYMPGMVLVVCLLSLTPWVSPERDAGTMARQRLFLSFLWAWVFYGAVIYFWKGESWTELRGFLAAGLYALVLRGVCFERRWILALIAISALGFVAISFWQYFDGVRRVGGHINPIPYATALGLVLTVLGFYWAYESRRMLQIALGFLLLCLVVALVMTQSRGVILPFSLIAFAGVLVWGIRVICQRRIGLVAMVFSVLAASVVMSASLLENRLEQTVKEYEAVTEGDWSGSIGLRLQMYRAALLLAAEAPFTGHGEGHQEALANLHKEGQVRDSLRRFGATHYHNQFMDYLVKKGGVGLLLFMGLIASSTYLIVQRREGHEWTRWAGLGAVGIAVGAAMTDVPFHHPAVVYVFVSLVLMLSAECGPRNRSVSS